MKERDYYTFLSESGYPTLIEEQFRKLEKALQEALSENESLSDDAGTEMTKFIIEVGRLKRDNELLLEIAEAAAVIYEVSAHEVTRCPHDITPSYPTHPWWCDTCFGRLGIALDKLDE